MRSPIRLFDMIKICSVLPALIVCAASAENVELTPIKGTVSLGIGANKTYSYVSATGLKLSGNMKSVFYMGGKTLNIDHGIFTNNTATATGAVIQARKGTTIVSDSDFISNSSTKIGGAVYVYDGDSINLSLNNTTFSNNSSDVEGGAIFSGGTLNITNSRFENNFVVVGNDETKGYAGGALTIKKGTATLDNVQFVGNHAKSSGAIFTYSNKHTLNIKNSLFDGNYADGAGAVQTMYTANIENTEFRNNSATKESGGAIFVGALGNTVLDNVKFDKNTAATRGGAISTRSADAANNQDARLDILNSIFTDNVAGTTGGALDNYLYSSQQDTTAVYINKTTFAGNKASDGGAIYNHGELDAGGSAASMRIENSNFMNNVATVNGGAIYNASGLTLAGDNVFSGNVAGGRGNDIHNIGTIDIESGTTTIGGGITGDGTLTLAGGATLNIGTAHISQGTMNLDGNITATALNDKEYGRMYADTMNIGSNTTLKLNVGGTGTYKIFNAAADIAIDAGDMFLAENHGADGIVISTKNVADISKETGLTTSATSAIVGLANNKNDVNASLASLRAQNALAAGDTDYVESETKKAAPTAKPVVHSVATSVQNQILSLTSARMAGGMIGRSGGDSTNADYGVWAHGLFNKSKFGGAFHGYTRGVAVGFDTLINHDYMIGAGYSYNTTDVHADSRDTDIDSNTLFVYGQYKPGPWYINGVLNYTMSKYDEALQMFDVAFNHKHDVNTFGAQVMTGYDFASGFTPEAGLRYLHVHQDAYNNGVGHVNSGDSDFLTGVAGIKYSFTIDAPYAVKWAPELRAAATYDFVSDNTNATVVIPGAPAYVVYGDRLSRMGGEFGIGLTATYHNLKISLNYDLDLHEDYTSQTGMLKFRYDF